MRQAFITELTQSDLSKIWLYIARDKPDAADRFVERLRVTCDRLAQSPALGKHRPQLAFGLRSFHVANYLIFYFSPEQGIEVARVLHGARELPRLF